jgi:hypothetical protein
MMEPEMPPMGNMEKDTQGTWKPKANERGRQTLLRLLRVKRSFFRLQTGDQFFDSIKHSPVVHSGRYPLVMLDLAVEFDALLTHLQFRIARSS